MAIGFKSGDRVSLFHIDHGVVGGEITRASVHGQLVHKDGKLYAVLIDGCQVVHWVDEEDVAVTGSVGHVELAARHIDDLKSARQELVEEIEGIDKHIEQVEGHKEQIEGM